MIGLGLAGLLSGGKKPGVRGQGLNLYVTFAAQHFFFFDKIAAQHLNICMCTCTGGKKGQEKKTEKHCGD